MILKVLGPVVTLTFASLTFWAAGLAAGIGFNYWKTAADLGVFPSKAVVLGWGVMVLTAIGCLMIVGCYLALKPKPVGRHGVQIEAISERLP